MSHLFFKLLSKNLSRGRLRGITLNFGLDRLNQIQMNYYWGWLG